MSVVAWILGIAFFIACPQLLEVIAAIAVWLLADPVGTAALGMAFAASLYLCGTSKRREHAVGRTW